LYKQTKKTKPTQPTNYPPPYIPEPHKKKPFSIAPLLSFFPGISTNPPETLEYIYV